jgi:polyhydroxyalkanoate synthesis regulator phasin
MPQPKRSSSSSKRSSSAKGSSAKGSSSSARKAPAARKGASSRARSSSARTRSTTRKSTSSGQTRRRSSPAAAAPEEFSGKTVAAFRDALSSGVLTPLNLVLLSRERLQEAVDDAVSRGRMTRGDATELVQGLLRQGYKQTNDVLADLEQLLGRARKHDAVDRVVRGADRARRVAGVGPAFPILGYDDLTAAQIASRLGELSPAELRKVRDYERRHGNRKSVLEEIERKLG